MIATSPTTADWWMLIGILILLVCLIVLSIAEMGLSRVSKPKAQALADSGARGGAALLGLVTHPERWVNPLLLSVNVCQTVQATLTGVVAGRLFGAAGVVIGVLLNEGKDNAAINTKLACHPKFTCRYPPKMVAEGGHTPMAMPT